MSDWTKGAAAIANARGARRGAPQIENILDVLPPKLRDEVIEDATACMEAMSADSATRAPRSGSQRAWLRAHHQAAGGMSKRPVITGSALDGLEDCPLHRRTLLGMRNVSQTQFSIARYYGGCQYNGDSYTYLPETDELIRDDVLQWKLKRKKTHRPSAKKSAGKKAGGQK